MYNFYSPNSMNILIISHFKNVGIVVVCLVLRIKLIGAPLDHRVFLVSLQDVVSLIRTINLIESLVLLCEAEHKSCCCEVGK